VPLLQRGRWALPVALLLAAVLLFSWLGDRVPAREWGERLGAAGPGGALLMVTAGALGTSIGLPRQLVALIAGYAFGIGAGLTLALVAALGGCALTLFAGRRWLAVPVAGRYPAQVGWLRRFVQRDAFLKILVLRLQPFGTNLISNLAAGVIGLSPAVFLSASLVGYVPQTLVFVLIGSGVRVGSSTELYVALGLLLVSLGLGALLWRRHGGPSA